jgi:multidrug transporter EmrE-like cation transporter
MSTTVVPTSDQRTDEDHSGDEERGEPVTGGGLSWGALFGAIALDVAATYALSASQGFRHVGPSVLAVVGFLTSLYLFGVALTGLGPSVAYAVFGAVGTASVALIGIAVKGEPTTWARIAALGLIVLGVTLLPVTER